MRLGGTTEDSAYPIGKLIGIEQFVGLNHLARGVDLLRFYKAKPQALLK